MKTAKIKWVYALFRNLLLIACGGILVAIGIKSIAIPHGFITGGFSGLSLLIYYVFGGLSPGMWNMVLNIPLFILGWIFLSRRFLLYSLFGMLVVAFAIDWIPFQIPIQDHLLAALASGACIGAGAGIYLHSLGSIGGTDVIAIILNKIWNVRIGQFFFYFNLFLFSLSLGFLNLDLILYSIVLTFIISQVTDYFLSVFNQRKLVFIISEMSDAIAEAILKKLQRGATFIHGQGAYSGKDKNVVMTVVNNYQLKRLEALVFGIDANAFFIAESTFSVLGPGFSRRKVY